MKTQAVVMIPLVRTGDKTEVVFEVRAESISQGGDICFPGGKIDDGESPEDAVIREVSEEMLIGKDDVRLIEKVAAINGPGGIRVEAFTGELRELPRNYNEEEIGKIFTLPVSFFADREPKTYKAAMELRDKDKQEICGIIGRESYPFATVPRTFYFYETPHGVIWGLTAEIIYRWIHKNILVTG